MLKITSQPFLPREVIAQRVVRITALRALERNFEANIQHGELKRLL